MIYFWLAFFVAAGTGAFFRFQASQYFVNPWGTLLANVVGSLLIGFLAVYLDRFSPQTKALILVAGLGSLTTFSSYSLEIVQFLQSGEWGRLALYFGLSNGLCLLGCFMGYKIANNLVSAF